MAFDKNNVTTANVGETVKFVEPILSDNLSSKENIKLVVFVIQPTGQIIEVKNYQYAFVMSGKHIVRYVALDEANNITIMDFDIAVSEVK